MPRVVNPHFKHERFRSFRPHSKTSPLAQNVKRLLKDREVVVIQVGYGYYIYTTGVYNRHATRDLMDWGTEVSIVRVDPEDLDADKLYQRVLDERAKLGQEIH